LQAVVIRVSPRHPRHDRSVERWQPSNRKGEGDTALARWADSFGPFEAAKAASKSPRRGRSTPLSGADDEGEGRDAYAPAG
jgi:hypothetical protein